jgi:hypothetical protein
MESKSRVASEKRDPMTRSGSPRFRKVGNTSSVPGYSMDKSIE